MKPSDDFEIDSTELRDFMPYTPIWIVRKGNLIILLVIMIAIVVACIVKYPEIVTGSVVITTQTPSIKIVNKVTGNIEGLLVGNDSLVKKGTLIAEVENPTTSAEIDKLKMFLVSLEENPITVPLKQPDSLSLGEAQVDYGNLLISLKQLQELHENTYYPEAIKNIARQVTVHQSLNRINHANEKLFEQELKNATARFEMNKTLFSQGVLSKDEFKEKEDLFLKKQQEYNALSKTVIQTEITINNLTAQKLEIENTFAEREKSILQEISRAKKSLNNFISSWRKGYTLYSPITGRVKYLKNISEKQFVVSGEQLFVVVPDNESYRGIVTTNAQGIGKVVVGQKALVSLNNFPVYDFGKLDGRVTKILLSPNDNTYTLYVSFGKTLVSTYHKNIPFYPEMTGRAEIIIDHTSLMGRVLKRFRKALSE